MPAQRLKEFLAHNGVKYVTIQHSPPDKAQQIATSAYVVQRNLAKTVMVKLDGKMAMAVLPASEQVDLDLLKTLAGAEIAELAREEEFEGIFPDCEVGTMPPFGNLYDLPVYVARPLADEEEIVFGAGSQTELFSLAYKDFEQLVQPSVGSFSVVCYQRS